MYSHQHSNPPCFGVVYPQVFSWDTDSNGPDEDETDGRSYISVISEVLTGGSCAKTEMGEARMDIEDSEMGYLGYYDTESYGLTWKVCDKTKGPPPLPGNVTKRWKHFIDIRVVLQRIEMFGSRPTW